MNRNNSAGFIQPARELYTTSQTTTIFSFYPLLPSAEVVEVEETKRAQIHRPDILPNILRGMSRRPTSRHTLRQEVLLRILFPNT